MESCIFDNVNNSIATKLCANLIENRENILNFFSSQHNSMTKLWSALFKCENKLKIG